jgi:hypothetical protein
MTTGPVYSGYYNLKWYIHVLYCIYIFNLGTNMQQRIVGIELGRLWNWQDDRNLMKEQRSWDMCVQNVFIIVVPPFTVPPKTMWSLWCIFIVGNSRIIFTYYVKINSKTNLYWPTDCCWIARLLFSGRKKNKLSLWVNKWQDMWSRMKAIGKVSLICSSRMPNLGIYLYGRISTLNWFSTFNSGI